MNTISKKFKIKKFRFNLLTNENFNIKATNDSSKNIMKNVNSTRHSTESNESSADLNNNCRKCKFLNKIIFRLHTNSSDY
jgi:hypothetical protein